MSECDDKDNKKLIQIILEGELEITRVRSCSQQVDKILNMQYGEQKHHYTEVDGNW